MHDFVNLEIFLLLKTRDKCFEENDAIWIWKYYLFQNNSDLFRTDRMASLKDYDFNALLDDPCDMFSIQLNVMSKEHQLLGTVKSHKLLLSLMSPVLQDMFTSQEENWNVIEINAVSVLSVQTLIQFLYNGDESIITG